MKNNYTKTILLGFVFAATTIANAQTVSTFENITLTPNSFWDGSDSTNIGGFNSGNAFFENSYDTQYFYWSGGFAVSNKIDTSTADTSNGYNFLYNAIVPMGANQSANYAVAKDGSTIVLKGSAAGKQASGVYITNSNYTYLSMKWGDMFAKQFTDSDYFKVNIVGYNNGLKVDSTISVFLADGKNLLNTWKWVDLTSLGNVDSVSFYLASSDTGQFGINTPTFFCIDNFTTRDISTGVNAIAAQLKNVLVYPNPASDNITIETATQQAQMSIYDITGKQMLAQQLLSGSTKIMLNQLSAGLYILTIESNGVLETRKLIVE